MADDVSRRSFLAGLGAVSGGLVVAGRPNGRAGVPRTARPRRPRPAGHRQHVHPVDPATADRAAAVLLGVARGRWPGSLRDRRQPPLSDSQSDRLALLAHIRAQGL